MAYNETLKNYLTLAEGTTADGQVRIRLVYVVSTNRIYLLDDEGTFNEMIPVNANDIENFDIDPETLANGDVLVYNSTSGKWENLPSDSMTLAGLLDVDLGLLNTGDVLIYNAATGKWENKTNDNMALSGLDDVLLTDISDKQLLAYDTVSEEWHNTSNVVLGNNSTTTETQYVAGDSVETAGAINNQHTTGRRGAQLVLIYEGMNVPQWDSTKLSLGVEIIDPTLTYRLQVVSLTEEDYVLTVNAMSEAEAIAFAALYPSGNTAYGLCLAVPITTNHINTVILGDNITATDDNSIYADSITISEAEIKDITIPGTPVWGAVLDDGTLLSDMVFAGTDRYLIYDAIGLTQFSEGEIIGFRELILPGLPELGFTDNYWAFTITDVIEVEGTTTQVWVTETHGTLATAYDDSDWETYAVTITPESTYTALNVGTGNTIAHNNSHIIGNDITTDAEDTLFVNKLNVSGSINVSDVGDPVVTTINTGKGATAYFAPADVKYIYIGGDQTGTITNGTIYSVYNSDGDVLLGSWPVASTHYIPQSENTKVTFTIPNEGIFPGAVTREDITNGYLTYTTIPDSQSSIHNLSVTDKLSQGTAVSYLPNMFSKSDIGNFGKYCNITMQRQTFDDIKQNFTIGDTAGLIVIPTNTIYNFRVLGVGADASGNTATYEIKGTAKNIAGTVTVANVTVTEITDDFTITGMSAEADDINNALVITATGKAATVINWSAFVEWQEITFA